MTHASITTNFNQALDVHLNIPAKIAFNFIALGNKIAQSADIGFCQVFYPDIRIYFRCG